MQLHFCWVAVFLSLWSVGMSCFLICSMGRFPLLHQGRRIRNIYVDIDFYSHKIQSFVRGYSGAYALEVSCLFQISVDVFFFIN